MAYQGRAHDVEVQEKDNNSESRSITARTGSSLNYRNGNGVSFSSASGFTLPQKNKKKGEDILEEDQEERNYMPIIIAQTGNNQRRLTKAERKRIEERRDRQENWAYADPDEVVEDASKDIWEKEGSTSEKMLDEQDSNTVESIVLGDKKNLLIYRFINRNSSQDDDSDTIASNKASVSKTKRSTTDNTFASSSSSTGRDLQSFGTEAIQGNDVRVSSSANIFSMDIGNNLFNSSSPLLQSGINGQNLFDNLVDATPTATKSLQPNQQSVTDFRAMISSGNQKNTLLGGNQVTISKSTDSLFGGSANQSVLPSSSFSLPSTSFNENPSSLSSSMPSSTKNLESTTRGIQRDKLGSPAIPRFTIKR